MVGMPAATVAGGQCMGMPDVCQVPAPPAPPIPTPFPNMGMFPTAVKTATTVLIMNEPAVVQGSEIPQSLGDEPGVDGGVVSGLNMGPDTFKTASSKVSFGGQKAVIVTSMSAHNGSNANFPAGQVVAPSQQKVFAAP
jgi:hypothetical protein